MFFIPHKKIVEAKKLVDDQKLKEKNNEQTLMNAEEIKTMRKAQNIVEAAVHPDSGEFIPRAFWLSSYAPTSIPTLFGFLLSKPTTFNIIFWQWANQTLNAGVNYANRNASSSQTNLGLIGVYTAAVTTSVGFGLGMWKVLTPFAAHFKGPKQLFFNFLISFAAVGTANFANCLMMRSKEISDGIMLWDIDGNEIGKSKIIGKKAVL